MNSAVTQWAIRNGVSAHALDELRAIWGDVPVHFPYTIVSSDKGEDFAQSQVRLEAPRKGVLLFRNNVGVLTNQETGRPVRYGLANDSKALNEKLKSADLIGIRRVLITPEHLGSTIGQFVSRECKKPGWSYKGDEHEQAQLKWAQAIIAYGGDAKFATGEGTL